MIPRLRGALACALMLAVALPLALPAAAAPRSFFGDGVTANYPWSGSRGAFVPPLAAYREAVVMAADTLTLVPIPADNNKVAIFSFNCDFWVRAGVSSTTFAVPAVTTTDGTGPTYNPSQRSIPATLSDGVTVPTHIALRSATACAGSIEFYAGPQ